jgi:ubiquinone/menaquinone biosynthesis C-methylase UbiE
MSVLIDKVGSVLSPNFYVGTRVRMRTIFSLSQPKTPTLDCGCGFGIYASKISEKAYVGIDVNKHAIKTAHKKFPKHNFMVCDAQNLPFKDRIFNYAICSDVLEHMKNDKKVLSELYRVAKLSGEVAITVPRLGCTSIFFGSAGTRERYFGHVRDGYLVKEITNILNEMNFKVAKVKFFYGPFTDLMNTWLLKILVKLERARNSVFLKTETSIGKIRTSLLFSVLIRIYILIFPLLLLITHIDNFISEINLLGIAMLAKKTSP